MKIWKSIPLAVTLVCATHLSALAQGTTPGLVAPHQVVAGPASGSNPQPPVGRALVFGDLPSIPLSVTDDGRGTLTISPTTGAVLAGINLSNSNTWSGTQAFSGTFNCTGTCELSGTPFGTIATQAANNVDITGGIVTGLPSPSSASDAATKQYVDNSAVGLVPHPAVTLATTAALPANTYSNGSSGVGATLTGNSNGVLTIDGTASSPTTTRILVKNEATPANNGIYTVTTVGTSGAAYVLTRATDANQPGTNSATLIGFGTYVLVTGGTANVSTGWSVNSAVATIGTSAINWAQFTAAVAGVASIGGSSGVILLGSGLSLTGSTINSLWAASGGIVETLGSNLFQINSATGIVSTSGSNAGYIWNDRSTGGFGALLRNGGVNSFYDSVGGFVINYNSSGNVGIGTTTPATLLHIDGASPALSVEASSGNATIQFMDSAAAAVGRISQAANSTGNFTWDTGPSGGFGTILTAAYSTGNVQFVGPADFSGRPFYSITSNSVPGCPAADPSGLTSSRTAIQCILTYIKNNPPSGYTKGGLVFAPCGTYDISGSGGGGLTIYEGTYIVGGGRECTQFLDNSDEYAIQFSGSYSGSGNTGLRDLAIDCPKTGTITTACVFIDGTIPNNAGNFTRVRIWGESCGLFLNEVSDWYFEDLSIAGYGPTGGNGAATTFAAIGGCNIYSESGGSTFVRVKGDNGNNPTSYGWVFHNANAGGNSGGGDTLIASDSVNGTGSACSNGTGNACIFANNASGAYYRLNIHSGTEIDGLFVTGTNIHVSINGALIDRSVRNDGAYMGIDSSFATGTITVSNTSGGRSYCTATPALVCSVNNN